MPDLNTGGYLVPDSVMEEITVYYANRGPLTAFMPERVPLTRWQRIRLTVRTFPHRVRWGIHDVLFPECRDSDYD